MGLVKRFDKPTNPASAVIARDLDGWCVMRPAKDNGQEYYMLYCQCECVEEARHIVRRLNAGIVMEDYI